MIVQVTLLRIVTAEVPWLVRGFDWGGGGAEVRGAGGRGRTSFFVVVYINIVASMQ